MNSISVLTKKIKNLAASYLDLITKKETVLLFKIKNRLRTPKRTIFMESIAILGSAGFIWMPPAFIMTLYPKTRLNGLLVFFGLGFDTVLNNLFTKFFFHRLRPCVVYPQEALKYSLPFGYSFPSGHALTSATGASIYIRINPLNGFWALPLAGLICTSRLYLFDHYPSDIIAGFLDGVLEGNLVYTYGHRLYESHKLPILNELIDDNVLFKPLNYLTSGGRKQIYCSLKQIILPHYQNFLASKVK